MARLIAFVAKVVVFSAAAAATAATAFLLPVQAGLGALARNVALLAAVVA